MATRPYELTRLDPDSFEHMANQIALRVLGAGTTGFGPGADGGRDGVFEGEAPYPSETERWSGTWYLQSKFHPPHLSKDAQKWLQREITKELDEFKSSSTSRKWPDNWIIVTNIDPSPKPGTGTYDVIREMVRRENPDLALKTHIWGGNKVLSFLNRYPEIARYYSGFLTTGDVIDGLLNSIEDQQASIKAIVRDLVVTQLSEQQFTKLEQAGSNADTRPGIQKLFVDLPFESGGVRSARLTLRTLVKASTENFRGRPEIQSEDWAHWFREPKRSKIWFIRGGPGQGKSTLTQYLCQVQRAAIIANRGNEFPVSSRLQEIVTEVRDAANRSGF